MSFPYRGKTSFTTKQFVENETSITKLKQSFVKKILGEPAYVKYNNNNYYYYCNYYFFKTNIIHYNWENKKIVWYQVGYNNLAKL